jgi:opacity protein-like surface antigen
MKKYLVAATLIVAFATPALAADYYVALRLGGGAAKCEVMTTAPDTKTYKMMGKYTSEAAAKAAMAKMAECQ